MYDAQIREPLFDYLDEKYPKNRIFEEKIMGKSRADIVMVLDGSLAGLEIKSDADTYDRLETQVKDYDKFCDYNYIMAGITHEKHVEEHVPEWWGILIVSEEEGKVKIVQKREAGKNRKCKVSQQIKWLWRTELNHILARNYLPAYKAKSKKFVQDKLLEKVGEEELKNQIVEELFERDYEQWQKEFEAYRKEQGIPVRKKRMKKKKLYRM